LIAQSTFEIAHRDLVERAASLSQYPTLASLDGEELAQVARSHSADFATALLYARIVDSERHGPFIDTTQQAASHWTSSRKPPLLVIVPGIFHTESMDTGADGQRFREIAEKQGFRTERIETMSFGSNAENAKIICEWLSARAQQEIVLVCLSKGTAEARLAMRENQQLFRNTIAVVNLSPVIFGSKLVDRVLDHQLLRLGLRCWMAWKGFEFSKLEELRYDATRIDLLEPQSPFVVNVCGFPLKRDLSSAMARRQYRRLLPHGPNDGGGILLADHLRCGGALFPIWGADHYLRRPRDIPDLIGRALCTAASGGC
jgi:hypothetical protein